MSSTMNPIYFGPMVQEVGGGHPGRGKGEGALAGDRSRDPVPWNANNGKMPMAIST